MRYVLEYTETEKQRKYYYMKGLPQAMRSILIGHDFLNLKDLINRASLVKIDLKQIALEKEALHSEKRKMPQPNP
jgi:lantibiotic modifying enzyme